MLCSADTQSSPSNQSYQDNYTGFYLCDSKAQSNPSKGIDWPFESRSPNYRALSQLPEAERKDMINRRTQFWFNKLN